MKKEDFVQQVKPALECLPRWAVVAFAARVARRVTPLYHLIVRKDVEGVALGVAWAWTMAAEATGLVEHDELARKVRQATRTPFVGDWITGHMLAHGAGHVADCVLSTLHASNSLKPSEDALQAVSAAFSAMSQAISVTGREGSRDFSICKIDAAAQTEFVEASMADLTWLVSQHEKHMWTDDMAVNPASVGVLWPTGKPNTWPPDPWRDAESIRLTPDQFGDSSRSSQV